MIIHVFPCNGYTAQRIKIIRDQHEYYIRHPMCIQSALCTNINSHISSLLPGSQTSECIKLAKVFGHGYCKLNQDPTCQNTYLFLAAYEDELHTSYNGTNSRYFSNTGVRILSCILWLIMCMCDQVCLSCIHTL